MVVTWQYLQVNIFSIHLNHGQNKPQAIYFLNMIFTRSSEIFEWNGVVDAKPGGAVNPTAPAKRKWPGKAVSTGGLPGQNRKERAKGWSFNKDAIGDWVFTEIYMENQKKSTNISES